MQKEIAGRSAVDASLALSGQAQHGAVAHAGRDLDLDRVAAGKLQAALTAPKQLVQRHRQLGLDVAARERDPDATPSAPPRPAPEQRREEVADVADVLPISRSRRGLTGTGSRREVHP